MPTAAPSLAMPPEPPAAVAQNFARLLDVGIAAAQRLSSDHWTDFNEHDPGVTILEALTYALTDISYRINHPIEDIIASSMAEHGIALKDQPLFTGDKVLTGAPLTERDFRKLAYNQIRELRDLWIIPASPDAPGLHRVLVHTYPTAAGGELGAARPTHDVIQRVAELMAENRPMGLDFLRPESAPLREIRLEMEITLTPDAAPEAALADILFDVSNQMNPGPIVREIGPDLDAGLPPDTLFDGPFLKLGWMPDEGLHPFGMHVSADSIADTVLAHTKVLDVGTLERPVARHRGDPINGLVLTVLGQRTEDLSGIILYRDGMVLPFEPTRVLAMLHHKQEAQRWVAGYAADTTDTLAYTRVPLGSPTRNLRRYRTMQALLPPIYRLGHEGVTIPDDLTPKKEKEKERENPQALRLQLKGYLLFFEQILADALAQLSHTADLFSFRTDPTATYFTQPLINRDGSSGSGPADSSGLLGQTLSDDKTWWDGYEHRLKGLAAQADPLEDRLNTMRDALLARFGVSFPNARLQHMPKPAPNDTPARKDCSLARRKGAFLAQMPALRGRRGVGLNPLKIEQTEFAQALRHITGHTGLFEIVDHVLLRPVQHADAQPGLRQTRIHVARLELRGRVLHLIDTHPRGSISSAAFAQKLKRITRVQYSAVGQYVTQARLMAGHRPLFYVLEAFETRQTARAQMRALRIFARTLTVIPHAHKDKLTAASLPLSFFANQVSVILAPDHGGPPRDDVQAFVSQCIEDRLPAHLSSTCYWLDRSEGEALRRRIEDWSCALRRSRTTDDPSYEDISCLNAAAERVRQDIERLHLSAYFRYAAGVFGGA